MFNQNFKIKYSEAWKVSNKVDVLLFLNGCVYIVYIYGCLYLLYVYFIVCLDSYYPTVLSQL